MVTGMTGAREHVGNRKQGQRGGDTKKRKAETVGKHGRDPEMMRSELCEIMR